MRLALLPLVMLLACREANPKAQEDIDGDGVFDVEDCDKLDPGVGSPQTIYLDADGDGVGGAEGDASCAPPTGYTFDGGDCNDGDPTIAPGLDEACDGIDNNCDEVIDEGVNAETWYVDSDGDGYGDDALSQVACEPVSGSVTEAGDCDDADPEAYPGAEVACTAADRNCDGSPDDADADGDRFLACEECDDARADVYPDAIEVCDGVDQDCDLEIDEDAADGATWYADSDGDGFGDAAAPVVACEPLPGEVDDASDCDDSRIDVYPGADEYCDTVDNDCDGEIDENAIADGTWYADADGDGHGVLTDSVTSCEQPPGYVALPDDCDDADAARSPSAAEVCNGSDDDCDSYVDADDPDVTDALTWYQDGDGDGYGDERLVELACGAEAGLVDVAGDCDDRDASAWPGAVEVCDGADNDCDAEVDEEVSDGSLWYADFDGDGQGDAATTITSCDAPDGYVVAGEDCDDNRADVYVGAPELCDLEDNDCDGVIDEETVSDGSWYRDDDADGWGDDTDVLVQCEAPVGYSSVPGDCDDADDAINPRAAELCNSVDDDCDGLVDDADADVADALTVYTDDDGDGHGQTRLDALACTVSAGWALDADDCDDRDPTAYPDAPETCDGDDDDCDGVEDEDAVDASTWYEDFDGDGAGGATNISQACDAPAGFVASSDDCDDERGDVYPGATELCDGADNDCDGSIDDSAVGDGTWYADVDGDGWGDSADTLVQCSQPAGYVAADGDCATTDAAVNPRAPELCNGVDDDCDGDIDADDAGLADGVTVYADDDLDGYGDARESSSACTVETGSSATGDDCDDADATIWPGAPETCDGDDDDCDGTDDEDAVDADIWYRDADADRWGDDADTQTVCSAPLGYVSVGGDCDDSSAMSSPSRSERCDGADNDCNGVVDEGVGSFWYDDADSDGYGDAALATEACSAPSGAVASSTDCDDTDPAVSPDATEVCNSLDDDCDGLVDDADPDLAGAPTWYIDYDRDGFGAGAYVESACELPSGYADNADDCDDTDDEIYPAATELCNGEDDDCDLVVDEDDAADAATWYADLDGDSYGDPASPSVACEAPGAYLADDTDCDDTDADVYPGARERFDGADNDCDGEIDDQIWVGTGEDGSLEVTGVTVLDTDVLGARTTPDAVAYVVSALSGSTVTVTATAEGIAAGDEVLIVNLHGSDAAYSSVGTYMTSYVASVSGTSIELEDPIIEVFGQTSNADLADQAILVQRVPQYTEVTVAAGGVLTASPWDGATGGVLFFRASGTVMVEPGGLISVDELGYAGGATGPFYNWDAYQGESYAGAGDASRFAVYNEVAGYWANNYGGGGAHICGGGGNYGGGATAADSWTGGGATPAEAGDAYGTPSLSSLLPGSGGGGVWHGSGSTYGPGGDGGGILYIGTRAINAADPSSVSALGGTTTHWSTGSWTYGAGGGAGGAIWLEAETLTLGAGAIDAGGGYGESTHIRHGGDGGYGRIRLDYDTLNGESFGSTAADSAADTSASPDPGFSALPE